MHKNIWVFLLGVATLLPFISVASGCNSISFSKSFLLFEQDSNDFINNEAKENCSDSFSSDMCSQSSSIVSETVLGPTTSQTLSDTSKQNQLLDYIIYKSQVFLDTRTSLTNYDSFCFFTDPHLFLPNNSFDVDFSWFEQNFGLLKYACETFSIDTVICGGDVLNNNDTKEQAMYKLRLFVENMTLFFDKPFFIVGNHDTNYQGNTFIESNDYESCMLDQNEINDTIFYGKKSYYFFDSKLTRHYCFDSGIDWYGDRMNNYRYEQIDWFASELLKDEKSHNSIFIHIGLSNSDGSSTAMMQELGRIIYSYNNKETITINGCEYDYKYTQGHVDYILSGHLHQDTNDFFCGGVPIISTRTFSSPEIATQPTFDLVLADYDRNVLQCFRIGDGKDRTIKISC